MQINETTKEEIKKRAEKMSDFLKMEYLEFCSKKRIEISALKYCYLELSKLYEKKLMYNDSVKYLSKLKEITVDPEIKKELFLREIELLIKGGYYDNAINFYEKTIPTLNFYEKSIWRGRLFSLFRLEAEKYETQRKNAWALKAYEKMNFLADGPEKTNIKRKLFELYKKLGKVKESLVIEKELETFS